MGSQRVGHDWASLFTRFVIAFLSSLSCIVNVALCLLFLKSAFYFLGVQSGSGEVMTSGCGLKKGMEGCWWWRKYCSSWWMMMDGNVPVPMCVTAAVSFMLAVPAPSAEAGTLCSGPFSLSPRTGSQHPDGESHLWWEEREVRRRVERALSSWLLASKDLTDWRNILNHGQLGS